MAATPIAPSKSSRLRWLTLAILAIGFGSAIIIYWTAGAESGNPLGYDPLQTKEYVHELKMYGGTASLLAAEFTEWFAGLWHGKNLAITVAFLTLVIVLILRFLAIPLPSPTDEEGSADSRLPPKA